MVRFISVFRIIPHRLNGHQTQLPACGPGTSDPAEEWPAWSQPVGAHDAYSSGAKVSHNGKHWISSVDNNVWEPGVYGWTEQEE